MSTKKPIDRRAAAVAGFAPGCREAGRRRGRGDRGLAPRLEKIGDKWWTTASIVLDDAVIVLDRANPVGLNFRESVSPPRGLLV